MSLLYFYSSFSLKSLWRVAVFLRTDISSEVIITLKYALTAFSDDVALLAEVISLPTSDRLTLTPVISVLPSVVSLSH